jgi:hypothetical protein
MRRSWGQGTGLAIERSSIRDGRKEREVLLLAFFAYFADNERIVGSETEAEWFVRDPKEVGSGELSNHG